MTVILIACTIKKEINRFYFCLRDFTVKELTLEDLKRDNYQPYARNKLIGEAFCLSGHTEKYGSVFLRIRKEISVYPTMHLSVAEISYGLDGLLYSAEDRNGCDKRE